MKPRLVTGTYSDLSHTTIIRFGVGKAWLGSAFGIIVRAKGGADIGKYTVKGNTVTITCAAPGGMASMAIQIE